MPVLAQTTDFWFLHHTLVALAVEDDGIVRSQLVERLGLCPLLLVHEAGTPGTAHRVLKACDPLICCCLLDLGLPDPADGYDVLRAHAGRIPIVVLTGRTLLKERKQCMELGAVIVLEKPVTDTCGLVRLVCEYAVEGRFLATAGDDMYCRRCIRLLFSRSPRTVTEWVGALQTDGRYLRRKWEEKAHEPRHLLSLYWGYRYAIQAMAGDVSSSDYVRAHRKRVLEYLACHTSVVGSSHV